MVMLPQQVMVCRRSIAQTAVATAAVADHKGEQDWGVLLQGEGLEVALVVVIMVISLHEREGSSGELAHEDGRHEIQRK